MGCTADHTLTGSHTALADIEARTAVDILVGTVAVGIVLYL